VFGKKEVEKTEYEKHQEAIGEGNGYTPDTLGMTGRIGRADYEREQREWHTKHIEGRLAAIEASLVALYRHLNLQRVRVTEETLDGLKRLAIETREEMRKVAKSR
jgi:hypothetical protein